MAMVCYSEGKLQWLSIQNHALFKTKLKLLILQMKYSNLANVSAFLLAIQVNFAGFKSILYSFFPVVCSDDYFLLFVFLH